MSKSPSSGTYTQIRCNRYLLAAMPEPPAQWTASDRESDYPTVNIDDGDLRRLIDNNLIHCRGDTLTDSKTDTVQIYEVKSVPYEIAQSMVESSEGPVEGCEHTGVRNLGDGRYTCGHEDCNNVVPREGVEWD